MTNSIQTEPTDAFLLELFENTHSIAVIGLSPVPSRPSFGVARYLIEAGFEIYGVRPKAPLQILDRPCFEHLRDLKKPIDLINVFRNSEAIPDLVNEIEEWMKQNPNQSQPRYLWLQEGISHREAEARARQAGLKVVSNRCILKEHRRLS